MKNKKGMTIAELIVSIVLVSVACIYFFQTIVVVNDLYKSTQEDTNLYLHKLYYYRLLMANNNRSFIATDKVKYDLPYSYKWDSAKNNFVIEDSNGNTIDIPNIADNTDVPDDNGDDDNNEIITGADFPPDDEGEDNTSNGDNDENYLNIIDCTSDSYSISIINKVKNNGSNLIVKNANPTFFKLLENFFINKGDTLNTNNNYILMYLNEADDESVKVTLFHCKNRNTCLSLDIDSESDNENFYKYIVTFKIK